MPSITDVIDAIATPPLASLQQVLDTNGPFGPGSHTLTQFHTDGAFLLPAGTYNISDTYGCIVQVNGVFPPAAGFQKGYVDPFGVIFGTGELYHDLIAQFNLLHTLPLTGAKLITERHDIHFNEELILWPGLIGSASTVGLYVGPNWHVDLYYMCVL